ncbi:PREDICTED: melanoma antigen preferentially expressed in tumors-like [Elephantulus edwardii]|uniref:melanoma antigen preferentially expressed in tumors-like n=1 Tax=Elephantulus edwardii TaxID=28737 RepID=UPI0003F07564|nr:PREDICTED: melanoma antigen preferentially expressed in tumors-like [Elephantulus edwardii]
MSSSSPPSLFDLTKQSLMKDEVRAIKALQSVPPFLVPPLMTEVVSSRNTKILQAMVQSWPFPCLPLRAWIEDQQAYPDFLDAALNGFDVLLDLIVPPSGCNLKVLDLRPDFNKTFWKLEPCNSQSSSHNPSSGEEQPSPLVLKLVTDLCFGDACGYRVLDFLISRIEKGKVLPQLCCRTLEIVRMPTTYAVKEEILQNIHLDCVRELEITHSLKVQDQHSFAPFLREMVQLNTLQLRPFIRNSCVTQAEQEMDDANSRLTYQFFPLKKLKHLFLSSVFYPEGHLGQILRYLDTPLETLSIRHCLLSQSDIMCLSRCPCTGHLKCLDLHRVILTDFNPELFRVLLQRVSATLEYLDLGGCSISDSQFTAMLPALCLCSKLHFFQFCGNQVSSVGLENLLRQTLPPNRTRRLLLPPPLECYGGLHGGVHPGNLQQYLTQLTLLFQEVGPPTRIRMNNGFFPYDVIDLCFEI